MDIYAQHDVMLVSYGFVCVYRLFIPTREMLPNIIEFLLQFHNDEKGTSRLSLARESIGYPYVDFLKFTVIQMEIHDFWKSAFNYPRNCAGIQIDIQTGIFIQGHSKMDIRGTWKSTNRSHVLWISAFNYPCFYGYPCMDLLWILDTGIHLHQTRGMVPDVTSL